MEPKPILLPSEPFHPTVSNIPVIYLDNNATTCLDPEVARLLYRHALEGPQNPSSQHQIGRAARRAIDNAMITVGSLLGTDVQSVGGTRCITTSGGTESNNLAILGLLPSSLPRFLSKIEHPSILRLGERLSDLGSPVYWLPVDPTGALDLDACKQIFADVCKAGEGIGVDPPRGLVSVMLANNETGVIQPLEKLIPIARAHGLLVHSDATQAVGKIPVHFDTLQLDALSFASHKFHGPHGIGGLLVRGGQKLDPLLFGGSQQLETRPGTEPVSLAVAMAEALRAATNQMKETMSRIQFLRDRLEKGILDAIPNTVIHGLTANRLPNTSCLSFLGIERQMFLIRLDRRGLACSTGSACSSGSSEPSHVLKAMNCEQKDIESALRFSLSRFSTLAEIDQAIDLIVSCYNKLKVA